VGPANHVLNGVQIHPQWQGQFRGDAHCKVQGHSVVMRAKKTEPIVMLFGLSARSGPRNYNLDGVQIPLWEGATLGKEAPIIKYRDIRP